MAELLVVVAIISILAGVGFIAYFNHQRTLAQVERDAIAKEIFVAAQNHLTVAKGEKYPGLGSGDFGTAGTYNTGGSGDATEQDVNGVYYVVVPGTDLDDSVLSQMLPFGAIDDTVRSGGSYIIRYHRKEGLVLDLFYCSPNGSDYGHNLEASEYETVMGMRGEGKKGDRKKWGDAVLGWYGGADALQLPEYTMGEPEIEIVNAEQLYVRVKDNSSNDYDNKDVGYLRLIIKGKQSKTKHYLDIKSSKKHLTPDGNGYYKIVLDEVTAAFSSKSQEEGGHFAERKFDDDPATSVNNGFIPGEDIEVRAAAYTLEGRANIAYSGKQISNSLFASIGVSEEGNADGVPNVAYIGNFRHLENLDQNVSRIDHNDKAKAGKATGQLNVNQAIQMTDLDWPAFRTKIGGTVKVYKLTDDVGTNAGCYYPIEPNYGLHYRGERHRITGVTASTDDAGLFGAVPEGGLAAVNNLELINSNITGTASAGALAGTLRDTIVTNVLARNSAQTHAVDVSGANAGGLAGVLNKGSIRFSAAALIVNGTANAGGLVGKAENGAVVTGCYSGGHTDNGGLYGKWITPSSHGYDVRGGVAGGLIGDAGNAQVSCCYTTCSVSGSTIGGFAGKAAGDISHSYSTGLLSKREDNAFLGSGRPALSDNHYFMIINKVKNSDDEYEYIDPMENWSSESKVKALDKTAATYESFVSARSSWAQARPYDSTLKTYYKNRYNLKSIKRLCGTDKPTLAEYGSWSDLYINTHYGDWPAPEVFLINP